MLESLSIASSAHSRRDEVLPLGTAAAAPQPSDALQATSRQEMRREVPRDIVESSRSIPIFKGWLQPRIRKSNKDPALHEPNRFTSKLRQVIDHQSRSKPPARVEESNVGPSTMAATRRVPVSARP